MGDVLSLIERAEATFDQEQAQRLEQKLRESSLNLEDFLDQLRQVKKMGSMSQILDMVPGAGQLAQEVSSEEADRQFKRMEAIITSMTPEERRSPRILNGSRKRRVARGSGTTVQDINILLNQFRQMQQMMKQMRKGSRGMRGLMRLFG